MVEKAKPEHTLVLPDDVRSELARPLGKLYPDIATTILHMKKSPPTMLVTVGDIVTARFIAAGVEPDIAVVDLFVMREPAPESVKLRIHSLNVRTVNVKNPAGSITPALRAAMKNAKTPLKVIVDGEEDLATIPAVLSAPVGSVVVYGQPGEGVVSVKVTEAKKKEFAALIKKFREFVE